MEKVKQHIEEWLSFCNRSYAKTTCRIYACVIGQLFHHVSQNGQKLSAAAIENFLDSKYKAGSSKRLFNTYRIVIRSFCNFRQRKYGIESPAKNIPKIREGRTSPRVLSSEEYKFILNFVSGMDRDILLFLGNTGLRKEEFRQLRWGDIDSQLKYVRVMGKGDKTRIIPINATVREILLKYRRLPNDQFLQISAKYYGIEGSSWLCRRISRKNPGMKPFGSYALRHFFATQLLRKGISLYVIQRILGHSSIKTTEMYLHLTNYDLYGATDVLDVLD